MPLALKPENSFVRASHRLDTNRSQCAQVLGPIALPREHPDDRGHGRMSIGCGRLAVLYQPRPA